MSKNHIHFCLRHIFIISVKHGTPKAALLLDNFNHNTFLGFIFATLEIQQLPSMIYTPIQIMQMKVGTVPLNLVACVSCRWELVSNKQASSQLHIVLWERPKIGAFVVEIYSEWAQWNGATVFLVLINHLTFVSACAYCCLRFTIVLIVKVFRVV